MAYVRMGKLGAGGMVGTHRLSGVRRLRGLSPSARRPLGFPSAVQNALIRKKLRGMGYGSSPRLGQDDPYYDPISGNDVFNPVTLSPITTASPYPYGGYTPSGGGLSPAGEASIITAGINAAGVIGKQAIIGTPTVTYNPVTGAYMATGGATLPSSLGLASISSYLPLVFLAGGAVLIFSMLGRR